MLGRLQSGQEGIIARLDKQNGSIMRLFEKTNHLENINSERKGEMKIVGLIWGGVSAIIIEIVNHIFINKL